MSTLDNVKDISALIDEVSSVSEREVFESDNDESLNDRSFT